MSDDPRRGAPRDPAEGAGHPGEPVDPLEPGAAELHDDPDATLVRDFFARERDAAPALAADPARWQAIVEASDRPRHPWLRYAGAAAAAVVVLGAIGLAALGRSTTPPQAAPTVSSAVVGSVPASPRPTTSGNATLTPSASPSVVPPPALAPVPASFAVRSLTTAASGRLFALGTVSCPGGLCPAVAGSKDNGGSWKLLHTFPASATAAGSATGRLGSAGTLTQVRFANPSVGWVFGGAAMRTTDGGATWQDYAHPGGDVIDLETDGTDVVLTTAPGCTHDGTCHGSISVARAPVTAAAASDVAGTLDGGERVIDAQVSWQGSHAFVSPEVVPTAGHPAPAPVAVAVDGLHPAGPTSCGTGQFAQLVTAAAGTTLFAVCPSGAAAGHLGYAVEASSDYGATWTPSRGQLLLVNAGTTSFAAADARTLLAVSGGNPDLHGSMSLSSDGGATWRDPRSAPPLPDHGWAWVGAPGGATFYALSGDGSGVYWKSTDRGETWSRVAVAGH